MIDGHIHLERGPYTRAWLNEFVKAASSRGITEIHMLEHSHLFFEFERMYDSVIRYNDYQRQWIVRHCSRALADYQRFVTEMRRQTFPVRIKFGLEVCYIEGTEDIVRQVLDGFDWDFVTGSVHWINGFGFDHRKEFWDKRDVNALYLRYYEIMANLIKSGLFHTVAHPDSIKCFGHMPTADLTKVYENIADLLRQHQMSAEMSAGLRINYGCAELGMNPSMLRILRNKDVALLTASDAHQPQDAGRLIGELERLIAG